MQAYWFEKAGAATEVLQFGERPDPQAGPGEVRVSVHVSAINPTDTKRRSDGRELGRFGSITPNNDGSGVIESVGEGVSPDRVGQRVWMFGAQAGRPHGTGATLCTVPSAYAVELPDNTSFEIGACMGVPAVTAHRAVFADGPVTNKTILVSGGSGRVGRYTVQIARNNGARVIGVVSAKESRDDLASLGIEHVIMRGQEDLPERVLALTEGKGVDRFVDVAFGANIPVAAELIKPNGALVSYGSDYNPAPTFPFLQFMYKNIMIRPFSIMGMPEEAKLQAFSDITNYLREDTMNHQIGARFSFDQMPAAHQAVEKGEVTGIAVVQVAATG